MSGAGPLAARRPIFPAGTRKSGPDVEYRGA